MRDRSLDSLRGIAALVVVVGHAQMVVAERLGWIKDTPLRLLVSGGSAVMVFYALSGFVLFLTWSSTDRFGYGSYLVKRAARIYPPFCFAILLSAALYLLVDPVPIAGLSDWFNQDSWTLVPTPAVIAGHLAMTDADDLHSLDNVMWSLVPEVRMSIVFPLIALAVRAGWRATLAGSVALSVLGIVLMRLHPTGWLYDPFSTLRFLYLFAGGALLAHHATRVRDLIGRLAAWPRTGLWAAGLLLLAVPPTAQAGLLTGAGALLILALAFADPHARTVLTLRGPLWLGRVSYSLYLIHLPILLTLVHMLAGRWPLPVILGLAIGLSLVAAEVMYRAVEAPSIRLGRWLAALRFVGPSPALPVRAAPATSKATLVSEH